jgi:hypothetical protein
MHQRLLSIATAIALGLLTASTAEAAKKNRAGKRGERAAAMMLGRFDRDGSGTLEQKESERVRQIFTALKKLDTDNNGELSDSEIAATKIEKRQRKAGGKRKGAKAKEA